MQDSQDKSVDLMLDGRRLIIRDWIVDDLEAYAHWNKSHHSWKDFDGPYYPRQSPEEVMAFVEKLRQRIEAGNWPQHRIKLVIADKDSNALIGTVGCYWECEQTNWLSVGLSIFDEANWSRGLGYEALGLWCDHLFATRPELVRLGFFTWSGNGGMMRLAEKLGFKEEARHRKARIVNDKYFDSMGYGILRDEWKDLYPSGFARSLE